MKNEQGTARRGPASIDHLIARGFIDEPKILDRVADELLYFIVDSGDEEPSLEE